MTDEDDGISLINLHTEDLAQPPQTKNSQKLFIVNIIISVVILLILSAEVIYGLYIYTAAKERIIQVEDIIDQISALLHAVNDLPNITESIREFVMVNQLLLPEIGPALVEFNDFTNRTNYFMARSERCIRRNNYCPEVFI